MPKRMYAIGHNDMVSVVNADGTVTTTDLKNGVSHIMRDGILQNVSIDKDKCPHKHIYPIIIDPAGGDVWKCMDCGEVLDDDCGPEKDSGDVVLPNFDSCPEIKF